MADGKEHVHNMMISTRQRGSSLLLHWGTILAAVPVATGERREKVSSVTISDDVNRKPFITELVHYESFGTPTGRSKACRPAVVVEIPEDTETEELELAIFRRNGILFDRCRHEETVHVGGTWHFAHD